MSVWIPSLAGASDVSEGERQKFTHSRGWSAEIQGLTHTLVLPQGFTLSVAGVLAITIGHRGYPGPVALWLFVVAAGCGFSFLAVASGAHREPTHRPMVITGFALVNLTPGVVVPVGASSGWWIVDVRLSFAVVGFVTVVAYLAAVALPRRGSSPVTQPRIETANTPLETRWRILGVLLIAVLMAQFDLWVVNTAAPTIQRDLHATISAMQSVVGGYALTYGTLLIAGGRFGDAMGRAFVLRVGVVLFALASVLCALAQTSAELVVARLVQGACAALMVPQVLGLITSLFPAHERRRAMSWVRRDIRDGRGAGTGRRRVAGWARVRRRRVAFDLPRRRAVRHPHVPPLAPAVACRSSR